MQPQWQEYWRYMHRYFKLYLLLMVLYTLVFTLAAFLLYGREVAFKAVLIYAFCYGFFITTAKFSLYIPSRAFIAAVNSSRVIAFSRTAWFHAPLIFGGTAIGIVSAAIMQQRFLGAEVSSHFGVLVPLVVAPTVSTATFFYAGWKYYRDQYVLLRFSTIQAQYETLKKQMQPHFLFNALNSLSELIETDAKGASGMVQRLADLYREILTNSKSNVASLASEVSIMRKYLELEKIRFGDRLNFSFNINVNAESIFIPSLILQTLVENAVKHGISKSVNGGDIKFIVSEVRNKLYHVRLCNTGVPLRTDASLGTGITNTKSRLNLLFGDRHKFNMYSDKELGTVVSFFVPGDNVVQS